MARFPICPPWLRTRGRRCSRYGRIGYYSRARNLHAAARTIVAHGVNFPASPDAIAHCQRRTLDPRRRSRLWLSASLAPSSTATSNAYWHATPAFAAGQVTKKTATALWQQAETYLPHTAIEPTPRA